MTVYTAQQFTVTPDPGDPTAELSLRKLDQYLSPAAQIAFGNDSNTYLSFRSVVGGSMTEQMLIDSNGNVGIGRGVPGEKLDVNGTVRATTFVGDGSGITGVPGRMAVAAVTGKNEAGQDIPLTDFAEIRIDDLARGIRVQFGFDIDQQNAINNRLGQLSLDLPNSTLDDSGMGTVPFTIAADMSAGAREITLSPYAATMDSVKNAFVRKIQGAVRVNGSHIASNQKFTDFELPLWVSPVTEFVKVFGSYGSENGQFLAPSDLAADNSGNIYVVDTDNHNVQKFDPNGTFVRKWGTPNGIVIRYWSPVRAAWDSSGNIYAADKKNNQIQKFDTNGRLLARFGLFDDISGIAVDGNGYVYAADRGHVVIDDEEYGYSHIEGGNRIQKFDASGNLITSWGSYGSGNGQFNRPWGVAGDASGYVYVADTGNHRIQKFNSNGIHQASWGAYGTGLGYFSNPFDVAVDAMGNIYVADLGNNRVQKLSPGGSPLLSWGSLGSGVNQLGSPYGLAVDRDGTYVYVADTNNNRIQKIRTSDGTFTQMGSPGLQPGQFTYPRDVDVDANGNLLIADNVELDFNQNISLTGRNARIQKMDPGGNFSFFLAPGLNDGEFIFPNSIAIDESGSVYVAESRVDTQTVSPYSISSSRVQKFDQDGNFAFKYGPWSGKQMVDIAVSNTISRIFALELDTSYTRILVINSQTGGSIAYWYLSSGNGNNQFLNPKGLAVDGNGNVYVTDTDNNRVQKLDSNKNFVLKWGGPGSSFEQFNSPQGIAVDQNGDVYVADTGNDRIQIFDANGMYKRRFGSRGREGGQCRGPNAIAVNIDIQGHVFAHILDRDNYRIEKFELK